MPMFHGLMIFSAFFLDKVHLISMVPRAPGPSITMTSIFSDALNWQSGVCRQLIWIHLVYKSNNYLVSIVSMGFITILYIAGFFPTNYTNSGGRTKRLFHQSTSHLCAGATSAAIPTQHRRCGAWPCTMTPVPDEASTGRPDCFMGKKCGLTSYRTSQINNEEFTQL